MLEKLAAPCSPPSVQCQNGTILGWLVTDRQQITIQAAEGGHDVTSHICIVHPEGEGDIKSQDVPTGSQNVTGNKCHRRPIVQRMFHAGQKMSLGHSLSE
jgi:hypothetical protein